MSLSKYTVTQILSRMDSTFILIIMFKERKSGMVQGEEEVTQNES